MRSFLDKLFRDFDEAAARRELELAKGQVQAIQDTLAAYEQWNQGQGIDIVATDEQGNRTVAQAKAKARANGTAGGRPVIRNLMRQRGPGVEWTTPSIRDALGLSPDADHGIQVALSRMKRDGELERPRMGVYRLPLKAPEADEGEEIEGTETLGTPPAKGTGQT